MGLNKKKQAELLFAQIGYGRENALTRPENDSIDRQLRKLIETANENGDVIINVDEGYYRPRRGVMIEDMEFKEYLAVNDAKAEKILCKNRKMRHSYEQMGGIHELKEQRSAWRTGSGEDFEQLRLQL